MEHRLIQLLLALNRINQRLKDVSVELEKLTSEFIGEDFDGVVVAEQLSLINTEDYE